MTTKKTAPQSEPSEQPEEVIAPVAQESVVYIGPTLKAGRLSKYEVFKGGVPEHVKALYVDHEYLETLIIPVSELGVSNKDVLIFGTELNIAYKAMEGV